MKPLIPSAQERVLFDKLLSGVCFLNLDRQITYWNEAAEYFLGYSSGEVLGRPYCDWINGLDLSFVPFFDRRAGDAPPSLMPGAFSSVANLRHKEGYWIPLQVSCFPLLGQKDTVVGAALVFNHAREQQDLENRLSELSRIAYYDALTDIPNRRYLEEKLHEALRLWEEEQRSFAGALGDVDFFKRVNDTYGHDMGDEVLREVASILSRNLRSSDVVGRWGGEEFLILLRNISAEDLVYRLNLLRESVGNTVVRLGDKEISVTISFGATEPRKGETPASLLSRIDDCLYRSKREGRNRVTFEPA